MKISKALVSRYLKGDCSVEEAQQLSDYFSNNPEELDYFLSEEEWETFVADKKINAELSTGMWNSILQKIEIPVKRSHTLRYVGAIAASIVLLFAIGWLFKTGRNDIQPKMANVNKASKTELQDDTIRFANTSAKTKVISLPDGSTVSLSPDSKLAYHEASVYRNVILSGEATFKVAKDKNRPFTVFAGKLATTALGTIFKVTAYNLSVNTKVRLIEGKVVVKPDEVLKKKGVKDVYLEPGNELLLDNEKQIAQVYDYNKAINKNKVIEVRAGETVIEQNSIVFYNQPLLTVFDVLEDKYNVKISCNVKKVAKNTFTGRFDTDKESLEDFLNTIATLNNLKVTHSENEFLITQ